MRAGIIAAVLTMAGATDMVAQVDTDAWAVRCGGHFQLCGYADRETEAVRLPFRYEEAGPFHAGLAPVRIDGRWGYIDPTGAVVIAPAFDGAGRFRGDYAEIRVGDAAGVINRRGRVVIAPQFSRILPFSGDVFLAEPLEGAGGSFVGELEGPFSFNGGLYNLRRGWLTEKMLSFSSFDDPVRGLIWARRLGGDEVWGLLRADGSWQVEPRYSHVQRLMEGRAVVRNLPDPTLPPAERQAGVLSGAVDRDGRLVVPITYGWLGYWRGGYGLGQRTVGPAGSDAPDGEPNAGLVKPDGSLLGGRYFDAVEVPEGGALPRVRLGETWRSIGPDGVLRPDQREGSAFLTCPDGRALIHRGGGVEARRADGRSVGVFGRSYLRERDCASALPLQRADRWFLLLADGTLLGGEQGYESTYGFDGAHAAVKLDGKWGVIDREGRFTVPPRYDELSPSGGLYRLDGGAQPEWINAYGESVPAPQPPRPSLTCPGGLTLFRQNGLWGMKDEAGATVIRPEHRVLSCFQNGVSWAVIPDARSWCPIGPDGGRREALSCNTAYYPMTVSHHRPEPFSEDDFESSVLWNLALLDYLGGDRPEPPRWLPAAGGRASYSVMPGGPVGEAVRDEPSAPGRLGMATLGALAVATPFAAFLWSRFRGGGGDRTA
jgi:hypothetical protein